MRLGLLGFPIGHSLSPILYKKFLSTELDSYQMFECGLASDIPSLNDFKQKLDGLNITSPYKTHFIGQVEILSPLVRSLGAVNTLAFAGEKVYATNTDLLAVDEILNNYLNQHSKLQILLLGDGVMARVTKLVASDLGIELKQFSRKTHANLEQLDLTAFTKPGLQTLIINACSRSFIFQGQLTGDEVFWDYNYSFIPHKDSLPSRVLTYFDGQEMLVLQAKAAIKFWKEVLPKLK